MAITITPKITGQIIDASQRYKYIFEPIPIIIQEPTSTLFYIKLTVRGNTGTPINTFTNYVTGEFNLDGEVEIDLAEVIVDLIPKGIYEIGKYSDISPKTITGGVAFTFEITTDIITTTTVLNVVPIIGCRSFNQFNPSIVYNTQPLTEWQYLGLTPPTFKGYPNITQSLNDTPGGSTDITPNLSITIPATGLDVCGGYLIWKSRFGGWMYWGFGISQESSDISYNDTIEKGLFEVNSNGNTFIAPDYTSIEESYSVTLKSIAVSNDYAEALKSLSFSPACYLMRSPGSPLELMRISSLSIPNNNLTNGVNVEVTLRSISKPSQNIR